MEDFILFILSIIAIFTIFAVIYIVMALPLYIGWNVLAAIIGFPKLSFLWAFILTQIIIAVNHILKF